MSTTTSVPASARKLPSGRRIAPRRSAVVAMCSRAAHPPCPSCRCEVTNAARPPGLQALDRLRDEVVVQAQAERAKCAVAAHGAIGEGRIADREVEMRLQLGPREILIEDPRMRLQELRDPRGNRIELDAGDVADVAQRFRHQRRKQAAADAGLEHAAAAEAEPHAQPPRPRGRCTPA